MGRKEQYGAALDESAALRKSIDQNVTGGVKDWTSRLWQSPATTTMQNMITDPTKRGMNEAELGGLKSRQADVLAGARTTAMKDISRQTAASGLGNTGIGIRQAREYGQDYARQQREGSRDVELANESMKRDDLWKAISGVDQTFQMEQQGLNTMMNSYGLQGDILGQTYNAISQMNEPGFWKRIAERGLSALAESAAKGPFG
jgi:hypothetical protein